MNVPLWVARWVGPLAVRGLFATVRFREAGGERAWELREAGTPLVFSLWHAHLLPLLYRYRTLQATALVSEHRDGEIIARIIEPLGFRTARGSSTRGGSRGLRALIDAAQRGSDLAITPDGPRGPARVAKEGVATVAQMTGAAVVPIAAACSRSWRIGSWDGFQVPKPFATVFIQLGEPIRVPPDEDTLAALARVQTAMELVEAAAARRAREDPRSGAASGPPVPRTPGAS